ncbi:HAD-IIB family hydrolase [Candidatus Kaiserbacteria bacterium]|nr:MAG: HAD-IIB family hydrolase [Candidatus Kaiserbacteria bacterium]
MKTWLIGSDLDGTLIYPDNSPEVNLGTKAFNLIIQKHRESHTLAYVTGRHLERAKEGVKEAGLIEPDFYICDVGTTIYEQNVLTGAFSLDQVYRDQLTKSWQETTKDKLIDWLQNFPFLTLQEDNRQGEFKLCYYVSSDIERESFENSVIKQITEEFKLQAIYSTDPNNNIGYLDILPKGASKESALNFLAQKTNISKDRIVYAGDSGNDLAVCKAGIKFIIPQKASEEVNSFFLSPENSSCIYYKVTEPFCFGLLEGLRYFKVF